MPPLLAATLRLCNLRGDQDGNWWWNVYDIVALDPRGSLALVGGAVAVLLLGAALLRPRQLLQRPIWPVVQPPHFPSTGPFTASHASKPPRST